jgi:hypothetical protein
MNESIIFLENNLSNDKTMILVESITKNTDSIVGLDNSFDELDIMILIEELPEKEKDNYIYKAFLGLPSSLSVEISFLFSFDPIPNFKWLSFPIEEVNNLKKFNVKEIEEVEFRDLLIKFTFKKTPSKKEVQNINLFRNKIINNLSFYVGELILDNNIGILHIDSQSNYLNTNVFYKEFKKLVKKLNISKIDFNH